MPVLQPDSGQWRTAVYLRTETAYALVPSDFSNQGRANPRKFPVLLGRSREFRARPTVLPTSAAVCRSRQVARIGRAADTFKHQQISAHQTFKY
ncbi:MAG: hypothetical protein ACI9QQ_000545, partial [Myxococcota bacterium]